MNLLHGESKRVTGGVDCLFFPQKNWFERHNDFEFCTLKSMICFTQCQVIVITCLGVYKIDIPCVSASLKVVITDENDNPPTFQGADKFLANIQENRPPGTEVLLETPLVIDDLDKVNCVLYHK